MKSTLSFLCLILFFQAISQTTSSSKIGLYKWNDAVLMQECNVLGADITYVVGGVNISVPPIASLPRQKFRVLTIDESNAIIQILDYTEKDTIRGTARLYQASPNFYKYNFTLTNLDDYTSLSAAAINSRNYGAKQKYFKVNVSVLDQNATKLTRVGGSLAAGVINFPFKFRPQKHNADFSGAFNFGAGVGYTVPHRSLRQFTLSFISGYSISNIILDSANTNQNQDKLSSTNNFTAFSFSLGALIQYQKIQAGVFLGWDRLSKINQKQFDWQYHGKPWISVGFGIAIFSGEKEKEDPSVNKEHN